MLHNIARDFGKGFSITKNKGNNSTVIGQMPTKPFSRKHCFHHLAIEAYAYTIEKILPIANSYINFGGRALDEIFYLAIDAEHSVQASDKIVARTTCDDANGNGSEYIFIVIDHKIDTAISTNNKDIGKGLKPL